jgi:hypothetical protein
MYKTLLHSSRKYTYDTYTMRAFKTYSIQHYTISKILKKKKPPTPKPKIQGVSRLVDITAGGDFLGFCDQKSSYKHVSDFGRLRS